MDIRYFPKNKIIPIYPCIRSMKVIFDHQLFSWQRLGGASKYFCMLLKNLPPEEWITTCKWSNNEYVEHLNLFPHKNFLKNHFFKGQGLIMHYLNKPYSRHLIGKGDFDVYHQTHFDPFALKSLGTKPMVTTFHDINFSTYNPDPKIVEWQRISLNRADRIIAVSHNTKKDLVELFNISPDKVTVIHHGIELPGDTAVKRLFHFPYLLYVGSRGSHKNFKNLAKAFSLLTKDFPDLKLVCTWREFTPQEWSFFKELGIDRNVVHLRASEDEINSLYRYAEAFVFPSLYEGFGIPLLEAMSNHCPVILARSSCLPEIAADAGLYFEPEEVEDIYTKIRQVLDSADLRNDLINKGDKRVKDFSWKKCADLHRDVYKSLI